MAHIQRLPPDVINRIAAGEVVQRPSAALKELLENALDAGSTAIQVTAQDGGLEVLQVCDDGSGIAWEDLPLLCERYATSKLRSFDDLQSIASFGFRGEALASLSYVAKVTVTTKSRSASTAAAPEASSSAPLAGNHPSQLGDVAWKATYLDGQLTQPPQPCAGNHGTVIRAERMFYNATVRRGALRGSEEWSRVVDVVSRYALAFPHVGFSCTREGGGTGGHNNGVVFLKGSDTLKNIRVSHGNAVASHLHPVYHYDRSMEAQFPAQASETPAEVSARVASAAKVVQALRGATGEGVFTISGFASDSTLLNRKPYLCLFINNRLVGSHAVRKCVEAVYNSVLTGGNKPFVVLFIAVPSERLDVNVHPTKKEVCLLDEDLIISKLAELLRACVLQAASARQLDMLKLQNTTAAALKAFHPVVATTGSLSSASAQQTLGMLGASQPDAEHRNSSSEAILTVLHDRAARGVAPSPLTSNTATLSSSQAGGGAGNTFAGLGRGNGGVIVAPCTVVRVEPQKGALDAFFAKPKPSSSAATTLLTLHSSSAASATAGRTASDAVDVDAPGVDEEVVRASSGPDPAPSLSTAAQEAESGRCDLQSVIDSIRPVTETDTTIRADATPSEAAAGPATLDEHGALKGSAVHLDEESSDDDDKNALLRDFQQFRARTADGDGEVGAREVAAATESSQAFHSLAAYEASRAAERYSALTENTPDSLEKTDSTQTDGGALPTSSSLVGVLQVETHVLTSVAAVVEGLRAHSSAAAQSFFQQLALVGVVDANAFMAQSGTSLYLFDTLRLVREVVFQRLFLRWADPSLPRMPSLVLDTPQPIESLLLFALAHDAAAMADVPPTHGLREAALSSEREAHRQRKRPRDDTPHAFSTAPSTNNVPSALSAGATPTTTRHDKAKAFLQASVYRPGGAGVTAAPDTGTPTEAATLTSLNSRELAERLFLGVDGARHDVPTSGARRYVRRLTRRLCVWRDMLREYFGVVLSENGEVVALPFVMNTSWPPNLRAVPLFLWRLAEAVPFPTSSSASPRSTTTEQSSPPTISLPSQQSASPTPLSRPPSSSSNPTDSATQDAAEAAQAVEEEIQCFTAIAQHVADTLYGLSSLPFAETSNPTAGEAPGADTSTQTHWMRSATDTSPPSAQEGVEMALMPCLKNKRLFYPPAVLLSDGTAQSIVSVESLYKVFERC